MLAVGTVRPIKRFTDNSPARSTPICSSVVLRALITSKAAYHDKAIAGPTSPDDAGDFDGSPPVQHLVRRRDDCAPALPPPS
jgi:hypothetical protein